MGDGILDSLTTYMIDMDETIMEEIIDETVEDKTTGTDDQDVPPIPQQMVNNHPTFYSFNISGSNNNVFNHVDKLVINNGGKQDEC